MSSGRGSLSSGRGSLSRGKGSLCPGEVGSLSRGVSIRGWCLGEYPLDGHCCNTFLLFFHFIYNHLVSKVFVFFRRAWPGCWRPGAWLVRLQHMPVLYWVNCSNHRWRRCPPLPQPSGTRPPLLPRFSPSYPL